MKTTRRAWVVATATFLASIAASINAFKVPPVLPVLMAELDVDMVTGGWFMSVSSLAGIVLAIPAAMVLARLGPRTTGLVALGCTCAGSVMGALARDATLLLAGRTIEGISMVLLAILAPTVVAMWFEPRERGLPIGIWAALVPVGNVIAFNTVHPIVASFGWRTVWWFGAALALGALIVFGLVVTAPPGAQQASRVPRGAYGRMLRNRTTWLLALTFGAFAFSMIAYNTWAPAYLTETLQIDGAAASFYASLMFLAAIPANVIAGWLLNRIRKRYLLLPTSFLITCILLFWSFRLGSASVVAPYMILLGFASNFVPASTFTFAPETMPGIGFAGLALAIVTMGSSTGSLAGPPVLGAILSTGNWTLGSTCLVIASGVGTLASWLATRRLARDAGA